METTLGTFMGWDIADNKQMAEVLAAVTATEFEQKSPTLYVLDFLVPKEAHDVMLALVR